MLRKLGRNQRTRQAINLPAYATADHARSGHPGDGRAASGQTRRHKEYHCRGEREARGPATPSTVQGEDHEPSEHACSNFGFASASFTRTVRRGCFGAERQERCRLVYRRFGLRVRAQCARQDDAGRGRPLFDRHRARDAAEIRLEQPHQGNRGRIQGGRRGSIAHYGTYSVDDGGKALTFNIEVSTFPNFDGTSQKRAFKLAGDQLTYTVTTPSAGGPGNDVVWKRIK